MTTPSIRSNLYSGFYNAPGVDKSGAVRMVPINTSVGAADAATTVYELFPFRKGCRFWGLALSVPDMSDNSSTIDVGYVYDDNVTYTNDVDYFLALSTASRAGGFQMYPTTVTGGTIGAGAGAVYATLADGYAVLTLNTSASNSATTITGYALVSYGDTASS